MSNGFDPTMNKGKKGGRKLKKNDEFVGKTKQNNELDDGDGLFIEQDEIVYGAQPVKMVINLFN